MSCHDAASVFRDAGSLPASSSAPSDNSLPVNEPTHRGTGGRHGGHRTGIVLITLRASEAVAQCIVSGPVCRCVCLWACLWVCYHDNSKLRALIFAKLGL